MVAARQHHVVPYLAANLDRLDIPGQARSELEAAAGRQRAGAAVLAADLSVALAALRDAGVRALAFKGVALAAQAYGDFAIRGAATSTCSWPPRTSSALIERCSRSRLGTGARLPDSRAVVGLAPLRPNRQRAHCSAATETDIDLHWHLVPTRGTFPDFDTLWERREVVSRRRPSDADAVRVRRPGSLGRSRREGRVAVDAEPARRARAGVASATPGSALTGRSATTSCCRVGLAVRDVRHAAGVPPVVDQRAATSTTTCWRACVASRSTTAPAHRPVGRTGIELPPRTARSLRRHGGVAARGGAPAEQERASRRGSPPRCRRRTPCVAVPRALASALERRRCDARALAATTDSQCCRPTQRASDRDGHRP